MITTKLHPAFNTPIDNTIDGTTIDHNALLKDLVHLNLPLIEIADNHKLRLDQLIAWAAQPAVRSLLDAADELANRIAAHKAAQGATAAVQTLIGQAVGLCESIREQEIASRGARTILRFHAASKPRSRKRAAGRPDSQAAALRRDAGQSPPESDTENHSESPGSPHLHISNSPSLRFPVFPFHPEPSTPMSPIGPMSPIRPIPPDAEPRGHSNGHHPPPQPP